ncbi:HAD family hydrolase [Streptomyces capparidis]
MRYDLIIFDNDGVLVDSEPIANRVLAAYLTELGHPTSHEESLRDFLGSSVSRIREVVGERSGRALPGGFEAELLARTVAAFETGLRPVAGMPRVLEKLDADGVPYCLASSSAHPRIRASLRLAGIAAHFPEERIFSAQDVARGKPAPDLFLHAARAMGADPAGCAVVEDSPLGVDAAVAAGMDVYGYAAVTPARRLARATALFTDPEDLPGLLA